MNVLTLRNRTCRFADRGADNRSLPVPVGAIVQRSPYVNEFRCLFCRVGEAACMNLFTGEKYRG